MRRKGRLLSPHFPEKKEKEKGMHFFPFWEKEVPAAVRKYLPFSPTYICSAIAFSLNITTIEHPVKRTSVVSFIADSQSAAQRFPG